MCRGCCCGTLGKHPDTDHDGQLVMLRELAATLPGARLSVLGCMGLCQYSNLVVVRPASGAGLVWLGGMLDAQVIEELCQWLRSGGLVADMPMGLAAHVMHDGTSAAGAA